MDISRFVMGYKNDYETALREIRGGHKMTHWMWYIFPQLKGLGKSETSIFYGIADMEEAKAFLRDEYLRPRLIEISTALLQLASNDARSVMGIPDDMKLQSSMTLFSLADPEETVFMQVLEKFFYGKQDTKTLKILGLQ